MPKPLRNNVPLKIALRVILFLLLYFLLPIYVIKAAASHYFKYLFLFYAANIIIAAYILRRNSSQVYLIDSHIQELSEKINLLSSEYSKENNSNIALKEKSRRYNSLKTILEKINQSLDLDVVAETLVCDSFSLIGDNKGVCVLYLVDNQNQRLSLFKTKKEDPSVIIKAKEGNVFDFWVLRHASPLLIENIKNDFRFDLERLRAQDVHLVSSLVSAPFISENKFLGIIRLDNYLPNYYSQDDLRFLVSISDLGAVALENSELFKSTQDLAIHDALTSLYTKGYFQDRIKEECKRCRRNNIPLSLLMLDIDFFKNYNDKFGHTAGDIVLKKVSQIITDSLSGFDPIISRFGGEEFCAIITGIKKKDAYSAADDLRGKIEKAKIILRRSETHITVSIGLAVFPEDSSDEDDLVRQADKAMYKAKQKGRNQVCCI